MRLYQSPWHVMLHSFMLYRQMHALFSWNGVFPTVNCHFIAWIIISLRIYFSLIFSLYLSISQRSWNAGPWPRSTNDVFCFFILYVRTYRSLVFRVIRVNHEEFYLTLNQLNQFKLLRYSFSVLVFKKKIPQSGIYKMCVLVCMFRLVCVNV